VLIQVKHHRLVEKILDDYGVGFAIVARPIEERKLIISKEDFYQEFDIDALRDTWFRTSYLFDREQSGEEHAQARFDNYKRQPLRFEIPSSFTGKMEEMGLDPNRVEKSGLTAAIIREKGTNGEREMAYALYLAGFDVKDVHMTDLTSAARRWRGFISPSSAAASPTLTCWAPPRGGPAGSSTTIRRKRHYNASSHAKIR